MRGSTNVVVRTMLGTEVLFEADTYFGSIRIFLKVLELGSMSDALVSGGKGGFPDTFPIPGTGAVGGVATICGVGVDSADASSDCLFSQEGGEIGILPGRAGGIVRRVGDGVRAGTMGSMGTGGGCGLQCAGLLLLLE